MLRQRAMSIAGILVALCTLTSGPETAEASAGAGVTHAYVARIPASGGPVLKHARAIQTPSVVGRVVDALGNAVADVTVVATPGVDGTPVHTHPAPRTRTDRRGRFRFVGLPPGEYVFVTIHGMHAASVSPAMPVDGQSSHGLEVVLIVGGTVLSA
jgi:hypothetical protein